MGCGSCSSAGCGSKTAGGCNNGCSTGGCNKLNAYDWLNIMEIPEDFSRCNIVELRFKGGRKEFYRNVNNLTLYTGDAVVVDAIHGIHIGYVSLQGELVRFQMRKKNVNEDSDEILNIIRLAGKKDLEKFDEAKNRELGTLFRTRQIINEMKLDMKLSDVEFQADNTKATFFYSADDRVDFRELIKILASEFKIRVEMRQISLRQEAGRLGGIGSCGRELCCSTWLTDFKGVSTSAARYQNLSLNPSKLSGQCGRLKCCLNYELDTYMTELKDIPTVDRPLLTEKGEAKLQKTDIFKKLMWFSYGDDTNWHAIDIKRVNAILAKNAKGEKVLALTEAEEELLIEKENIGNQINKDLELMDQKYQNRDQKRKKKKKKKKRPTAEGNKTAQGNANN
jgi:cell fate regulator YaaT (PSP1 superfamily)